LAPVASHGGVTFEFDDMIDALGRVKADIHVDDPAAPLRVVRLLQPDLRVVVDGRVVVDHARRQLVLPHGSTTGATANKAADGGPSRWFDSQQAVPELRGSSRGL